MSNLTKLDIAALDVSGRNYLAWALDAKLHLKANGLLNAIDKSKTTSDEEKAKAIIFLRHHLHDNLKNEYITGEDPADLWLSLKGRFDHQKYMILPKAKHDWLNLRFQDHKCVSEYNSAMYGITSRIKLCGEDVTNHDMIEKTLQTFHAGNVLLQQQYRAIGFTEYSALMQMLLVAEQNNEIVMMNHQARPTGSAPFPEVNVASSNYNWHGRGRARNRGCGYGRGRGRGRGRGQRRGFHPNNFKGNEGGRVMKKQSEHTCYRCGMKGHWSRTCRTPKHLVDLYQESLKTKGKGLETNFISDDVGPSFHGMSDETHLNLEDFLADPESINEKDISI